jgi:general secretion pathway protein G
MVDVVRRLLMAGLALGVIAGNTGDISRFYDETVDKSRRLATAADLRTIGIMLDHYFMKKGRYPRDVDFMKWMNATFRESPDHEFGLDFWNNPLIYESELPNKRFVLASAGSDGIRGTSDDLTITGP